MSVECIMTLSSTLYKNCTVSYRNKITNNSLLSYEMKSLSKINSIKMAEKLNGGKTFDNIWNCILSFNHKIAQKIRKGKFKACGGVTTTTTEIGKKKNF